MKQQLTRDSRVVNASIGSQIPGNERMGGALLYPKEKQANGNDAVIPAATYVIDYDYIPTLGMKIASGRNFSRDFPTDSAGDFVGNVFTCLFTNTLERLAAKMIWT